MVRKLAVRGTIPCLVCWQAECAAALLCGSARLQAQSGACDCLQRCVCCWPQASACPLAEPPSPFVPAIMRKMGTMMPFVGMA